MPSSVPPSWPWAPTSSPQPWASSSPPLPGTTRLGTALHFNSSLNLQLDLSRQQPEEGDTNHSLSLNLQMDF